MGARLLGGLAVSAIAALLGLLASDPREGAARAGWDSWAGASGAAPRGLVVAEGGGSASAEWARIVALRMVAHAREHLDVDDVRVAILGGTSRAMRRRFEAAGAAAVLELDFARDDDARAALATTHVVWMVGGAQSRYVQAWNDTPVEAHMEELWERGGAIGGSSAGCAVLGRWVYDAREGSLDEREALGDAAHPDLTLRDDFLELVPGVLFDTHFTERGRLARLATMCTHLWNEERALIAIGLDDRTAFAVDGATGRGEVIGEGAATLLLCDERTSLGRPRSGQPPHLIDARCEQLIGGHVFDLGERVVVARPERTRELAADDVRARATVKIDGGLDEFDGDDPASFDLGAIAVVGLDDERALVEGRLATRPGRGLMSGVVVVPRAFCDPKLDEVRVGGAQFALHEHPGLVALLVDRSIRLERRGTTRLRIEGRGEAPHRSLVVLDGRALVATAASTAPAKGDDPDGRTRQSVALEGLRLSLIAPGASLDLR